MTQHEVSIPHAQNASLNTTDEPAHDDAKLLEWTDDGLVIHRPPDFDDQQWRTVRLKMEAFWEGLTIGLGITGGQR